MKTKEELNALKEEVATVNKKLAELSEEELAEVPEAVSDYSPITKKYSALSLKNATLQMYEKRICMPRNSKYLPLTVLLQNNENNSVKMTFDELNRIIEIPPCALTYRNAWANGNVNQASPFQKGWLNAGYIVSAIDINTGWVVFTKGEPRSRITQNIQTMRNCQIDEEALIAAIQKGYDCCDEIQGNLHHRYRSWEHCHKVFKQHKDHPKSVENDTLCLHLAWYLASWGMLRNSFLMQKDYRIHSDVVDLLFETEWDDLWDITAANLSQEQYAKKIMNLSERITAAYTLNDEECVPTDTLLTKILLGTIGCVPAYDRYFRRAIARIGVVPQKFTVKSLTALGTLYVTYSEAFEALHRHCCQAGFAYPAAKIIDMCFFEYGLTLKGNDENPKEE